VADEVRRVAVERLAHETRQALHIRLEGAAAGVGKNVHRVAALGEPAGEQCHRRAREPQPRRQDDLRFHPLLPSRAKMALARTIGFAPATR
jgi:hypothetical protein